MTTCIFTPTHDPWSCTVHSGGYRSSLQQDRCRVEPLSPAEVEEFDRWAEGRQSKGVSLGMLWALRLRATIAAGVTLDPSPAPDTALRARISLEAINGIRPVWIGEGVFEQYAARTAEGWPVTIEWGEPDADGFYSPTFTEHPQDATR